MVVLLAPADKRDDAVRGALLLVQGEEMLRILLLLLLGKVQMTVRILPGSVDLLLLVMMILGVGRGCGGLRMVHFHLAGSS